MNLTFNHPKYLNRRQQSEQRNMSESRPSVEFCTPFRLRSPVQFSQIEVWQVQIVTNWGSGFGTISTQFLSINISRRFLVLCRAGEFVIKVPKFSGHLPFLSRTNSSPVDFDDRGQSPKGASHESFVRIVHIGQ